MRDLLGALKQPRRDGREVELARARARHPRQLGQRSLGLLQGLAGTPAGAVDQPGREPLLVVEQDFENMFRRELLMPLTGCETLRRLDEPARAFGVFFDVHKCFPIKGRPLEKGGPSSSWPLAATLSAIWARVFEIKGGGTKRRGPDAFKRRHHLPSPQLSPSRGSKGEGALTDMNTPRES